MAAWGRAWSGLKISPVWKWPASARVKSVQSWRETYLSMSNPRATVTVKFSSTTARVRERTVTTVFPRLRPRLAQAMPAREKAFRGRRVFFRLPLPSVYRTASTGETLAAIRPGRAQERNTVSRANPAEPRKITGLTETTSDTPSSWATTAGVSRPPTSQPTASPMGMPTQLRRRACCRSMVLICRPVVPMVFSRP